VKPPSLDLGQPPEPLHLEELDGALQLGEVLLDHHIGKLGQDLGPQRVNGGSEFAQRLSPPNIRS
jgi:hypothetical protein